MCRLRTNEHLDHLRDFRPLQFSRRHPIIGIVCSAQSESTSDYPLTAGSALQLLVTQPTMASADSCHPIPTPLDTGSTRQNGRPPRVMRATFTLIPAAYTSTVSVQVSGFEDNGLLTHCGRLVCDSCSSGQCFAFGFLQIPPRGGHPYRSANRSPCRVDRGLPPPSHPATTTVNWIAPVKALRAMPGAPQKKGGRSRPMQSANRNCMRGITLSCALPHRADRCARYPSRYDHPVQLPVPCPPCWSSAAHPPGDRRRRHRGAR